MDTLIIERKLIYGRERLYPVNDLAKNLLKLTGRKTFYESDLDTLKEAGFKVQETEPPGEKSTDDIFS